MLYEDEVANEMSQEFEIWWQKFGHMLMRDFDPQLTESQQAQFKMALEGAYTSGDAKGSLKTMDAWGQSFGMPPRKPKPPTKPTTWQELWQRLW